MAKMLLHLHHFGYMAKRVWVMDRRSGWAAMLANLRLIILPLCCIIGTKTLFGISPVYNRKWKVMWAQRYY